MSLPFADVRGRDRAGLLRLAFTLGKRLRVDRRARAEQGIVRWRDARGQDQRVEVDVGRRTRAFSLHPIERQGGYLEAFAVRRPGDRGVVGGIARLPDDDDQTPAQRLTTDLSDQ